MLSIFLSFFTAVDAWVVSEDTINNHPSPWHIASLVFVVFLTLFAIGRKI